MRQREGPQLWGWPEEMNKSFSIPRDHFGAVRQSDKVCLSVAPEFAVVVLPWTDH